MACINCKSNFNGEYCPNCGEKKNIERISFISTVTTAYSGLIDMDKGFLYNLKNLTLSPQKTILQYIRGKRKHIFNPISYAIISVTAYLIVISLVKFDLPDIAKVDETSFKKGLMKDSFETGKFIGENLKNFWLLNIVYLSLFTKLFFKKYNFFEHLAINSFIIGHLTLLAILNYLVFKWIIVADPIVFLGMIVMLFLVHKNKNNKAEVFTVSFISVLFTYLSFIGIPLIIKSVFL